MIGFIGVFWWYNQKLKDKCKMTIRYFKIVPKSIMNKMKMTNYMRKNDLLKKFAIL